jgi:hypothetical protein
VCVLLLGSGGLGVSEETPPAALAPVVVPATGTHSALLTVSRFGRYAVTAASAQGTAIQLVDRMAGPGATQGSPGANDGRLDLFLDRGQYKIVTTGDPRASGEARLAVHPFTERNAPRPPRLPELKLVESQLRDFEQISYWIEVKERRSVAFEAAGRALADLRLWRDGEWLVDATPAREYVQPRVGQPLYVLRLATTLSPGLYLLTAYGGVPQAWAEESAAHPFYIRSGIPVLGPATRARYTMSPFGIDRFRVPGDANYLRLELPEATDLTGSVNTFDTNQPFADGSTLLTITKKTVPPVAETELTRQRNEQLITVRGAAGQPYLFQSFGLYDRYDFHAGGSHWISTIHSGHPTDSVDATAILVSGVRTTQRVTAVADATVELDAKTGWARRANLLDTLTVFLKVKEAGAYTVASKGTEARFRIEPFLVEKPQGYKEPPFRTAGGKWDLDAGLYVLTIEPVTKGILDAAIKPTGLIDDLLSRVGLGKDTEAQPVQAAVRFSALALEDHDYYLYTNRQPGVATGVILRSLPIDLGIALPVSLRPGETLTIPCRAGAAGTISATLEDGAHVPLSVDGGESRDAVKVGAGDHKVALRYAGKETASASLALLPEALDPKTPLPEMPDTALAGLPHYPIVAEGTPRTYDLVTRGTDTFQVRADKPGLYRLETTGLLSLQMDLRTRTVVSFAEGKENGTGRNALLQQYLREGDYQATVQAQGHSAGHAGVVLTRSEPAPGGFLTNRVAARTTLMPGQAIVYRFNITKPGRFHLRALALGRKLHCRLEDADGWPVVAPGGEADIARDFDPGKYRFVVLPENAPTRVVTVLAPLGEAPMRSGHGPHRLGLGDTARHMWLEPEDGGERAPDVWEWQVPAAVRGHLALDEGMEGELVRVGDKETREPVAHVTARSEWTGALTPGRYRLEAVCGRRNNRVVYEVRLATDELVAGLDRDVAAPADVAVAVGKAELVELSSFGTEDVKARLFDADGRLVAENDDRPDDWNFLLVQSLEAGVYRLRVEPVGTASASTRVSFRVPREEDQPALAVPADADVVLGRQARVYPVQMPAAAELFAVDARSSANIGLALESLGASGWQRVASAVGRRPRLALPLAPGGGTRYRLRLWSLDRRESNVRLHLSAPVPIAVREDALHKGVTVSTAADTVGAVHVALERPGIFRIPDASAWLWCESREEACRPADGALVMASGREMWAVAAGTDAPATSVRGERVRLGAAEGVTVRMAPGRRVACDLADHDGPVMVTATSQVGTPGVRLGRLGDALEPGDAMAVGAHAAVAVALDGRSAAAVSWPAAGREAFEVALEAHRYPKASRGKVENGRWDGALDGEQASLLDLPSGRKRVRLAVGEDIVAALVADHVVRSVHWNDGRPFVLTLDTDAAAVALFHTRSGRGRAALQVAPLGDAGERAPALAAGAPYESAYAESGWLRLPVAAGSVAGAKLRVRGADGDALFVGAHGGIARGDGLLIDPAGGTLLIPHPTGWVLAWIEAPGASEDALWGAAAEHSETRVAPPAVVPLTGTARVVALEMKTPSMLHLRSAAALVTRLDQEGAPARVEVHPQGTSYDAYLPAGRSTLWLRALGGGALAGTAEIAVSEVIPVGEGLGPEVLLSAGDSQAFSFKVERSSVVGIGVRASAELVEAALLNEKGERLADGPAQMWTLEAGTYLLVLRAPVDAPPVTVRPALVGLAPPDVGPPQDVIRGYVTPEEATGQFQARRADESAESPAEGDGAGVNAGAAETEGTESMGAEEENVEGGQE